MRLYTKEKEFRNVLFVITLFFLFSFVFKKETTSKLPLKISLWTNGAPGFEYRKEEPEQAQDWWVRNVHNPSITAYFPEEEKNTGAAVLICPGGGHRRLVYNAEGVEPAEYLTKLGVTAFVLKYRLARDENSPYSIEKHAKEDAYRAMRIIRSRAKEWNLDTSRIGMMGFSAGGELVSMVSYANGYGNLNAKDPIDRCNGKPDFQILIYPGPLGVPENVDKDAPPMFMLAANDDPCCAAPIVAILEKYRLAGVSAEVHLYAQGNHAFNMGNRSNLTSIRTWPQRLADWLSDTKILVPEKK